MSFPLHNSVGTLATPPKKRQSLEDFIGVRALFVSNVRLPSFVYKNGVPSGPFAAKIERDDA